MTNKEIATKRREIERLILSEKNKIKLAEENKKSYQLRSSFDNTNKPKPIIVMKPAAKPEVKVSPKDKIEPETKVDVLKNEASTTNETNEEQEVGKVFYLVAIIAGLVLIAAIVVLMIGIVSNWGFWM